MGSTPTAAAAMQAVAEEVHELRVDLHKRSVPMRSVVPPLGRRSDLNRLPGLALALRLCRDGDDTLAKRLVKVPDEHRDGLTVHCLCGADTVATGYLEPCAGDCGRWFAGDESGVWSARLDAS